MKIAILNQKGGVGKTTATVLLACALAGAGRSVGIIDRDPQQSAAQWVGKVGAEGVEMARPGVPHSFILIDTPGSAEHAGFLQAVSEADRIIIPCRLSPFDIRSTQATAEFVRLKRPKLRPMVLFTQVITSTRIAKTPEEFAKALGLRAFQNVIPQRQNFVYAGLYGYKALNAADKQEISNLAIEVISMEP